MAPSSPTGVGNPEEATRLVELALSRGVRFIKLEFTDVLGMAKCVTIPTEQLADTLAYGKWFDGSSIENFARVAETDMYLRPDLGTYAEVPWRSLLGEPDHQTGPVARLICDVLLPTGERFEGDPRAVLIAALKDAAEMGYRYEVSPELEFFLLKEGDGPLGEPLRHDTGGYFDLSTDLASDVRREIVAQLGRMGIRISASHHEVAAGQHEIDFVTDDALRVADAVVTTRYAVKAIAQRHGLWATFLPKPFFGVSGSGMHTHQRLIRIGSYDNAFADPADAEYGLSSVGRQFIAGQLAHAPGLSAVVSPLVNSYKRLVPGFEAPVMISWGRVNREALVRVARVASGSPEGMRVELRSPDPSCNPYLAFAAMLRAGLDGMRRELSLGAPIEEGLYTLDETARLHRGIALLPASLGEALDALQRDDVVLGALGTQIAAWFTEFKSQEWAEYQSQVTRWEIERYASTY